ncbi:MAG TPA: CBS domain-containing protein [Candidatus Binatia bacterium]|nr:CBS domain-containing protein [Candidatus Binatia bacterium]
MSPRAAARLETLGFEMVFDYVAGKQDWLANDLPFEGELAQTDTLGRLADRNVPTCLPTENAAEVQRRLAKKPGGYCVVVDEHRVVLGLLRKSRIENGDRAVGRVMEPGPTTFRPYTSVEQVADYVKEKNLDTVLVTTSDGRLVGALRAEDLRRKRTS